MEVLQVNKINSVFCLTQRRPMGCEDAVLPKHLLENHALNCLTQEEKTKQPYWDNLCLFRARALHFDEKERLEEEL